MLLIEVAAFQVFPAPGGAGDLSGQSSQSVYTFSQGLNIAVEALIIQAVDQVGNSDQLLRLINHGRSHGFPLAVREDDGVGVLQLHHMGLDPLGLHGLLRGNRLAPVAYLALSDEGQPHVGDGSNIRLSHAALFRNAGGKAVI